MEFSWLENQVSMGCIKNIRPLAEGANNLISLLEFENFNAVLKKAKPNVTNKLQNERNVILNVNGKIAPKLLYSHINECNGEVDWLILEHVVGKHNYVLNEQDARFLGNTLKCLHEIDVLQMPDKIETPTWKDYFNQRLMSQFEIVKYKAPHNQIHLINENLGKIYSFGNSIDYKLNCVDVKLIHSDLIPLNVIFESHGCRIIDWELARFDYPEWDICSVFKSFQFGDLAKKSFFESYQLKIDEDRYMLCALMHYTNVALWRLNSFYCKGENQAIKDKFLMEIDEEIAWVKDAIYNNLG